MNKQTKERIAAAIKQLKLSKKDLKVIEIKTLEQIAATAKTTLYNVMYYLRFEV